MKRFRHNKVLGLALGDRSLLAAEVSGPRGEARVTAAARFDFPQGVGFQQPEVLGAAVQQFLKDNNFTAKSTVIGLPAKWVLSKAKELPPVAPRLVADTLRLQAETDFSPELRDLVYDYASAADEQTEESTEAKPPADRQALLVATTRRQLDQAEGMAKAAGLKVVAIAPTSMVLAAASGIATGERMTLTMGPAGAEFSAERRGAPSVLRHIGSPASTPLMIAEVRRAATFRSTGGGSTEAIPAAYTNGNGANGNGHAADSGIELTVWGTPELDSTARKAVREALGVSVKQGDLASMRVAVGGHTTSALAATAAPAVALGLAGLGERPPVDFLHSRLAAPKRELVSRPVLLGALAAVVVVGSIAWLWADVKSREAEVASIRNDVAAKTSQLKTSDTEIVKLQQDVKRSEDRMQFAMEWYRATPRIYACIADLTTLIPRDGKTYITQFIVKADLSCTLGGKSTSPDAVREIKDRMGRPRFANVNSSFNTRDTQGGGSEVSFTITFTYVPEGPATRPAGK